MWKRQGFFFTLYVYTAGKKGQTHIGLYILLVLLHTLQVYTATA